MSKANSRRHKRSQERKRSRVLEFNRLEPRWMLHGAGHDVAGPDHSHDHHGDHSSLGDVLQDPDGNEYVAGEVLVKLSGDLAESIRHAPQVEAWNQGIFRAVGLQNPRVLFDTHMLGGHDLISHWTLPANANVLNVVNELQHHPDVEYAEPNYVVHASATPDDTRFGELYGMTNIDAELAWDVETGDGTVVIGVIDSGVNYSHSDLAANIWTNPLDPVGDADGDGNPDDDGNGYIDDHRGWDFVNNDNDPKDDNGHGTHVAGTIGAVGNNGNGVVGVNWNVKIMPLKFLDRNGSGSTDDAIAAVEYATMMRLAGVNIVATNNSWGGGGYSQALEEAIANAGAANTLFVAAAGNSGGDVEYPAAYDLDNIISVAATDQNDQLASFSNRGEGVDLAAPGVEILSTHKGSYKTYDGTSMASPHVAGAVSLVWNLAGEDATYQQVRDMILDSVDVLPQLDGEVETGGRLNLYQAIQQVQMEVVSSSPFAGQLLQNPATVPDEFPIEFSYAIDSSTLQASDFSITRIADGEEMFPDNASVDPGNPNLVTFQFTESPLLDAGMVVQGPYIMNLDYDAVQTTKYMADPKSQAWSETFYFDTDPLEVSLTSPLNGDTAILGLFGQLDVTFNQRIDANSLDPSDLQLDWGNVVNAVPWDVDSDPTNGIEGARFMIEDIDREGTISYQLATGSISDFDGNPLQAYAGTVIIDVVSVAFDQPFAAQSPESSHVHRSLMSGIIGTAADVDEYTINVESGQTISIAVHPTGDLIPDVTLLDALDAQVDQVTSTGTGQPAIIQTVSVPAGGQSYKIQVGGTGTGAYQVEVVLNGSIDNQANGEIALAQDISSGWQTISTLGQMTSVTGTLDTGIPVITTENENGDNFLSKQNDLRGSWQNTGVDTWSINGIAGVTGRIGDRTGSGPLASNDDQDTFYFTALAGDIVTISSTAFSVDLHDATEATLVFATPAEGSSFNYPIDATGEYWIHVYDGSGDYTMNLEIVTPADLSATGDQVNYYEFQASGDDTLRLVADTHASQSAISLELIQAGGSVVAVSSPTERADAYIEYVVPGNVAADTPYQVRLTTAEGARAEFLVDYTLVVGQNVVLDLERNTESAPQPLDADGVAGRLGGSDISVLWVGGTTPEEWNDGSFTVTQAELAAFPADLSSYDVIYVDSNAGLPTDYEAQIDTFVAQGGGLVTENGGQESDVDYSWVPNYSPALTWIQELSDDNRLTDLGHVHPVTAGMTDQKISNWSVAGHNVFPETGGMDVLATDAAGRANILVLEPNDGSGRLVYLGMDADGHRSRGEAHRMIRQSLTWAANPVVDADTYSIDLNVGDTISLTPFLAAAGAAGYSNTADPVVSLYHPDPNIGPIAQDQASIDYTAGASGTYLIVVDSANGDMGDYRMTVDVTSGPAPPPEITIGDAQEFEGNSGTTIMSFTVTRSGDLNQASSVSFATANDTATSESGDYVALTDTLDFANLESTKTIEITVNGDLDIEPDETFFVELSSPTNAVLINSTGTGIILDDDDVPPPDETHTFESGPIDFTILDDKLPHTTTLYVDFNGVFAPDSVISDVNVLLNISHTRVQDLDVYLTSPTGQRVMLFTDVGGNGAHFTNTELDDEAFVAIGDGTAPFTGVFQPEESLSAFDGFNGNSNWILEITDDHNKGGQNNNAPGVLHNWSISITAGSPLEGSRVDESGDGESLDLNAAHNLAEWYVKSNHVSHDVSVDKWQLNVADLPGAILGLSHGSTITLDHNAAGMGWFIDRTPWENSEFKSRIPGVADHYDLLSVLAHEFGHLSGHDHDETGLMSPIIEPGQRTVETQPQAYFLENVVRDPVIPVPIKMLKSNGMTNWQKRFFASGIQVYTSTADSAITPGDSFQSELTPIKQRDAKQFNSRTSRFDRVFAEGIDFDFFEIKFN